MKAIMPQHAEDTIVAVATPPGTGGIAVIRISGPDARAIAARCFDKPVEENRKALHGWIRQNGEPVDEVIVTLFRKPHSYTGEDVVEISCHGGSFVSRRIVDLMIQAGARPARPGEFTERAFLNGRMDLSQAEAIADLIHAQTEASRRAAVSQLEGKLSERIRSVRQELVRLCGLLEVELDFSEEEMEFASRKELSDTVSHSIAMCDELLESYKRGRIFREGVRVAITGSPNVGKSSLLNALLERERAIVSETPGTTRDVIEEAMDVDGILFIVSDGAGLRETEDTIEKEGVRRAEARVREADIVLLVLDGSRPILPEEKNKIQHILEMNPQNIPIINKSDLPTNVLLEELEHIWGDKAALKVSAKTGQGIHALINKLKDTALGSGHLQKSEATLTRARHFHAIQTARGQLEEAQNAINLKTSQEFIALDLRGALDALGEITGETTTEEILNGIFSEFCIGK